MAQDDREFVIIRRKLARKDHISSGELIEFLATNHTVSKKFICDFLIDRSHTDSIMSLITANMLIRDCSDANPSIRSCSILALSSLHDMEEVAINIIHKSIKDHSPQVRRSSALSCLELIHKSDSAQESVLIDLLYEGIRDADPIVITNCLMVLEDALQNEGGIALNKTMIHYLLSRLETFSESGIIQLFNLFTKYIPEDENETLLILNHLDSFLKSDSLAILLATVQLFFKVTSQYSYLVCDMILAIRYSVVNILSRNEFEYSVILLDFLLNFKIPLARFFSSHYKCFMLKFCDSTLIKSKKLKVLTKIAVESTVLDILKDLKLYAKDIKIYKSVYLCLGVLGTISADARYMVIQVSISSLTHSNFNIAACSLECILKLYFLNHAHIPKELMNGIFEVLLRTDLMENYIELHLCVLESYCTIIPDVQQLFELLFHFMDKLDCHVRCRILEITTKCFFKIPATIYPIIVPMIAKCFNSPDYAIVSCAAFSYAQIENKTITKSNEK